MSNPTETSTPSTPDATVDGPPTAANPRATETIESLRARAIKAENERNQLAVQLANLGQAAALPDKPENAVLSDGSPAPGAKLTRALNYASEQAEAAGPDAGATSTGLGDELGAATSAVTAGHPVITREPGGGDVANAGADTSKR